MGRTERVQNCLAPKFSKKFLIDYYFELMQKLKFGVYDIDNKTIDLSDDDFLGELECTLGQVSSFLLRQRKGQSWSQKRFPIGQALLAGPHPSQPLD